MNSIELSESGAKIVGATVTQAEFMALLEAEQDADEDFARNSKLFLEHRGPWWMWPEHLKKDLFQKLGVEIVWVPTGHAGPIADFADPNESIPPAKKVIGTWTPIAGGLPKKGVEVFVTDGKKCWLDTWVEYRESPDQLVSSFTVVVDEGFLEKLDEDEVTHWQYTPPLPGFDLTVPAEKWVMPEAKELLEFINSTPVAMSLLYDLNLLPEQIENGVSWCRMVTACEHMKTAIAMRDNSCLNAPACPCFDKQGIRISYCWEKS